MAVSIKSSGRERRRSLSKRQVAAAAWETVSEFEWRPSSSSSSPCHENEMLTIVEPERRRQDVVSGPRGWRVERNRLNNQLRRRRRTNKRTVGKHGRKKPWGGHGKEDTGAPNPLMMEDGHGKMRRMAKNSLGEK